MNMKWPLQKSTLDYNKKLGFYLLLQSGVIEASIFLRLGSAC